VTPTWLIMPTHRRPTRRSRRLSGLPPIPDDARTTSQQIGESATSFVVSNRRHRNRKSIKTPQKRNILSISGSKTAPKLMKTANEHDHDSDYDVTEGMLTDETKIALNNTKTYSPDLGLSDNEHDQDEEEKDYILSQDTETPRCEAMSNTLSANTNCNANANANGNETEAQTEANQAQQDAMKQTYNTKYKLMVILYCIFLLYLISFNVFKLVLSMILFTVCKNYLFEILSTNGNRTEIEHEIYVILNAINAAFVIIDVLYCILNRHSIDYVLHFDSNKYISFGLFLSNIVWYLWNEHERKPSVVANKWASDLFIVSFLVLFNLIGDNAIDLIFVYSIKSLIIAVMRYCTEYVVFVQTNKDIQANILIVHVAAFLSLSRIFDSSH